ncbi:hypothetical protein F5Y08DRAFT_303191 [Xylaria arbuscula]|nr:hypothetical protein F5Y08DRAFT_303191 [Xylaria arbuscula]
MLVQAMLVILNCSVVPCEQSHCLCMGVIKTGERSIVLGQYLRIDSPRLPGSKAGSMGRHQATVPRWVRDLYLP